jgi:hypothetical protein
MFLINATLTSTVQSATPTGFNPVTGEPMFGTISTVSLSCSLEEDSNPTVPRSPGIEETAIYLIGRAIDPAIIPPEFIPNQKYACTITLSNSDPINGSFYLLPSVKSRLGLESVFNTAIAGWFVR